MVFRDYEPSTVHVIEKHKNDCGKSKNDCGTRNDEISLVKVRDAKIALYKTLCSSSAVVTCLLILYEGLF